MGVLLIILAVIAGIVVALLLLALFIPRHYSVTVSTLIDKPKSLVFDYVRRLENQLQYSEWYKVDTSLHSQLSGTDGSVGAVLKWNSNHKDLGMGEQEIKQIDEDNIDIELRFIKPIAGTCKLKNHLIATSVSQTLYACTFSAYAKYPINLPSYLLGRRFIRKAQLKTLNNVKVILEAQE